MIPLPSHGSLLPARLLRYLPHAQVASSGTAWDSAGRRVRRVPGCPSAIHPTAFSQREAKQDKRLCASEIGSKASSACQQWTLHRSRRPARATKFISRCLLTPSTPWPLHTLSIKVLFPRMAGTLPHQINKLGGDDQTPLPSICATIPSYTTTQCYCL